MVCYGQDEMACHLHPILCRYHLHSSNRFPSTCGAVMLEKEKKKMHPKEQKEMVQKPG